MENAVETAAMVLSHFDTSGQLSLDFKGFTGRKVLTISCLFLFIAA